MIYRPAHMYAEKENPVEEHQPRLKSIKENQRMKSRSISGTLSRLV